LFGQKSPKRVVFQKKDFQNLIKMFNELEKGGENIKDFAADVSFMMVYFVLK